AVPRKTIVGESIGKVNINELIRVERNFREAVEVEDRSIPGIIILNVDRTMRQRRERNATGPFVLRYAIERFRLVSIDMSIVHIRSSPINCPASSPYLNAINRPFISQVFIFPTDIVSV